MALTIFIKEYLVWHYGQAFKDITSVWHNFLWFGYHFFSIPLLLKTLFSPFYRIKESYQNLEIQAILESLALNSVTRVVGFAVRSLVIIAGLAFEALLLAALVPVLIFWALFPFALIGIFLWGLALI